VVFDALFQHYEGQWPNLP